MEPRGACRESVRSQRSILFDLVSVIDRFCQSRAYQTAKEKRKLRPIGDNFLSQISER